MSYYQQTAGILKTPMLEVSSQDMQRSMLYCSSLQRQLMKESISTLVVQVHANTALIRAENSGVTTPEYVFSLGDGHEILLINGTNRSLVESISCLDNCYDLILISLESKDMSEVCITSPQRAGMDRFLSQEGELLESLAGRISCWLTEIILRVPVWGCVLIGGKSSRMGRPKHLITNTEGVTWLERTGGLFSKHLDNWVVAGGGSLPESLEHQLQLPDIPQATGPLGGIVAAMRWNPYVSWIVCACDMPQVSEAGISWLLSRRKAGVWGTVPVESDSGRYEPLLALYDRRCLGIFERVIASGNLRISAAAKDEKIENPVLPAHMASDWKNCNAPEDLDELL